jgi:predicted acetyltransferase
MELTVIDLVTLTEVPVSQRHVIANLIQLYKYDFSEFAEIGSPYGEVGSDGRYTYDGLDSYWQEEGRFALATHADARLAGFILVNRWSALNRQLDHSVGEFFVLRKYRRLGVGSRAGRSYSSAGRAVGKWA